MKNNWVSVKKKLPESNQVVFCFFRNNYGCKRIVKSIYIKKRTVVAYDFFNKKVDEDFFDYDENNLAWVPEGFYEDNYMADRFFLNEKITHWMPFPNFLVE